MQFGGLIKRKVVLDGSAIRILPILLLWQKSTVFLKNTISNFCSFTILYPIMLVYYKQNILIFKLQILLRTIMKCELS